MTATQLNFHSLVRAALPDNYFADSPKNKDFWNARIVSKPVAGINYKTRSEAEKSEPTYVLYFMSSSRVKVPKRKGFDISERISALPVDGFHIYARAYMIVEVSF